MALYGVSVGNLILAQDINQIIKAFYGTAADKQDLVLNGTLTVGASMNVGTHDHYTSGASLPHQAFNKGEDWGCSSPGQVPILRLKRTTASMATYSGQAIKIPWEAADIQWGGYGNLWFQYGEAGDIYIPFAGVYLVEVNVVWAANTAGTRKLEAMWNPSGQQEDTLCTYIEQAQTSSGAGTHMSMFFIGEFPKDAVFWINGTQTSGGNLDLISSSNWQTHLSMTMLTWM